MSGDHRTDKKREIVIGANRKKEKVVSGTS